MTDRSGWFIDDIELHYAPEEDRRVISRTFQSDTLFNFFPELTKHSARSFDYTVKGLLLGLSHPTQLDQLARSADTNTITVRVPPEQSLFVSSTYAIKNLTVIRNTPMFVNYRGQVIQVIEYTMTFTELPDEGEFQEGINGFTETDEESVGEQYYVELADSYGVAGPLSSAQIFKILQSGELEFKV